MFCILAHSPYYGLTKSQKYLWKNVVISNIADHHPATLRKIRFSLQASLTFYSLVNSLKLQNRLHIWILFRKKLNTTQPVYGKGCPKRTKKTIIQPNLQKENGPSGHITLKYRCTTSLQQTVCFTIWDHPLHYKASKYLWVIKYPLISNQGPNQ